MALFDKKEESRIIVIKKYYNEPDSPISLIFTNKIIIDWDRLRTLIDYNSTGYKTY